MSAHTNRLRVGQDGVFTNVEHAVLAKWFRQRKPAGAASIKLDDALAQLGFEKPCDPYSRTAAAVAHVLLEAIEDRLRAVRRGHSPEQAALKARPCLPAGQSGRTAL